MTHKKIISLCLSLVLALSMFSGCSSSSSETKSTESSVTSNVSEAQDTTKTSTSSEDDNKAAAEQLLVDLTGKYQELWPVILDEQYNQLWFDDCAAIVGEDNAQAAFEKLSSMVTATVYGEEAVKAYADGNAAYECAFINGLSTLEFDGENSTIKGYDGDGNELFSHSYHYVGMEKIRGLYEFESDDDNSGEFSYFCLAPDTSATTYHIEFRYGSDLDALGKYDQGNYAYWLASGISTDYDSSMVENCIELFCTENLSE